MEQPKDDSSRESFHPEQRRSIERDHEIWKWLEPGDQIEVVARGYSEFPPSDDCEAVIRIYERWKPSPAMLALL